MFYRVELKSSCLFCILVLLQLLTLSVLGKYNGLIAFQQSNRLATYNTWYQFYPKKTRKKYYVIRHANKIVE